MSRSSFNDDAEYRGGAIERKGPPRRYPCFATGCPMPGTLFTGSTDEAGTCAWHYGNLSSDIPKVTKALQDWSFVAYEIIEARRVLTGELAKDPKAIARAFAVAWERMQATDLGEWAGQLKPDRIQTSKGEITNHAESYGDWAKRLERFIGARVVEVQQLQHRRAA
jgi:hypothetical protein